MLSSLAISRITHEANRAYCEVLSDLSFTSWNKASYDQQECTLKCVEYCLQAKRTPEELHNFWLEMKRSQGWVHGPIRDERAKQHPEIKPYSELSSDQKRKDVLFLGIVKSLKGEV